MSVDQPAKYFIVQITLREKAHPHTEKVVSFSSSAFDDIEISGIVGQHQDIFAGLKEIIGLGNQMGEVLPLARTGTIVISNSRGTVANDKRLSDFFEKYSFVRAPLTVYSLEAIRERTLGLTEVGAGSANYVEFVGEITDVSVDVQSDEIALSVTSDLLNTSSASYVVGIDKFPDAPTGNIGRRVPVIIGSNDVSINSVFSTDVEVNAINVESGVSGNDDYTKYLYGTNFSDVFFNSGINRYLVKNPRTGDYQNVTGLASTSTIVDGGRAAVVNDCGVGVYGTPWLEEAAEFFIETDSALPGGVIVGGRSWYHDNASATRTGAVFVKIYDRIVKTDSYGTTYTIPGELLAQTQIPTSELLDTGFNCGATGAGTQNVLYWDFQFETPIVIKPGRGYFLSRGHDKGTDHSTQNIRPTFSFAGTFYDNAILQNGAWDSPYFGDWHYVLYGLAITDTPAGSASDEDARGLRPSYFTISKLSRYTVDISGLEFVVRAGGLRYDAGGEIASPTGGTPCINNPAKAVHMLYAAQNEYSGTGLTLSSDNVTRMEDFPIHGHSDGDKSYRDIIKEILSNFAMKLLPRRNGDVKIWCYGETSDPVALITEQDCRLENIQILGRGNIINSINVAYDKRAVPLSLQLLQQNPERPSNYAKSRLYTDGENTIGSAFTFDSVPLYGIEETSVDFESLNWVEFGECADRYAKAMFAWFANEQYIFTISVPFWKKNFREIELFDIIELSHPDNPSDRGSDAENTAKLPSYLGEVNNNFVNYNPWRRAKRYKLRVIGRDPVFNLNKDESRLILKLRSLSIKETY